MSSSDDEDLPISELRRRAAEGKKAKMHSRLVLSSSEDEDDQPKPTEKPPVKKDQPVPPAAKKDQPAPAAVKKDQSAAPKRKSRMVIDSDDDEEDDDDNEKQEKKNKVEAAKAPVVKKESPSSASASSSVRPRLSKVVISEDEDDEEKEKVKKEKDDTKKTKAQPKATRNKPAAKSTTGVKRSKPSDDGSDDDGSDDSGSDDESDFVEDDIESDGDDDYVDESDDDKKGKKGKSSSPKKPAAKKARKSATKRKSTGKGKKKDSKKRRSSTGKKRGRKNDDDDYEDDGDDDDSDVEISAMKGGLRWKTLTHNGPLFPPAYEPHRVPLIYDGESIVLPPEVEEAASFYARYLQTDHVQKSTFNKNFFKDFRALLRKKDKDLFDKIKSFDKCDFTRIERHLKEVSERKKAKTKSEKERQKKLKEEERKKYGFAIVDGVEQRIGNYIIEPPGLFLGRGAHPMTGKIKKRIMPEDVTLNLGVDAPIPPCPIPGHKWGNIVHDDHVTWLASWHEGLKDANKYVWLHSTSSIKGASDQMKYETARKLKDRIEFIRKNYMKDMRSRTRLNKQRATAIFLIDKLALRVGGEKGEDEADTVGCCSLRVEHISFPTDVDESTQTVSNAMFESDSGEKEDDKKYYVKFDFLAKDSMRYLNVVHVPELVFKNLQSFTKKSNGQRKKPSEELFDELSTTTLNKFLKSMMDGLTAKVFRTYNASITLQRELAAIPNSAKKLPNEQKLLMYNRANRQVAILCNHQRTIKQTQFSSSIGGLKLILVELIRKREVLAKHYKKLGGSKARLSKLLEGEVGKKKVKKEPKKKKSRKTEDGDDFEDVKKESDDEDDDSQEVLSQETALQVIDEKAITEDDEDIQMYMKVKEERAKAKEQRDKLVKEAEEEEAKRIKAEADDSEDSDDGKKSKKKGSKASKVKKEAGEEEEEELEKEKKEISLPRSVEQCEKQILAINERILKTKLRMVEKGELRNVALSTSKLNYLDPRISVAFCKRLELPLERVFQKALREKFTWALDAPADFEW